MKILYNYACSFLIVIGLGHLSTHFFIKPSSAESIALLKSMESFKIKIIGSQSLLNFHHGFSMLMGFLLVFLGVQSLLYRKYAFEEKNVLKNFTFMLISTSIIFIISLKYFFIIP